MRYKYGMVIGTGETFVVKVWDKPHAINVYHKSKTVWAAVGEYLGKQIEVTGPTQGSAIRRWIEAARYRGN
jgi:hypothetical protein